MGNGHVCPGEVPTVYTVSAGTVTCHVFWATSATFFLFGPGWLCVVSVWCCVGGVAGGYPCWGLLLVLLPGGDDRDVAVLYLAWPPDSFMAYLPWVRLSYYFSCHQSWCADRSLCCQFCFLLL